jgi:S1-C subfamily serine protease
MPSSLVAFSDELTKLVKDFQNEVVAVHARPRYPSSGVHWRPGLIVTADHAIRREEDIQVTIQSGESVSAALVGRDTGTDLALLRVEGLGAPPVREEKAEKASVGELALVLGRSPDSGPNASLGIISAVSGPWRTWRGGRLDHYIRLDANLFPNSSGGAVVDGGGRLLGIATAGLSRIAGLAIPASTVNRVIDHLLQKGRVPRGYLGIAVQPVVIPDGLRSSLALANSSGVMVVSIEANGPASQAGFLLGDILVGLGKAQINGIEDLQSFLDEGATDTTAEARFIRAGKLLEADVAVGESPGK